MDRKDWAIVILLLLAASGPLGVHFWHTQRKRPWDAGHVAQHNEGGTGPLSDTVPGQALDSGDSVRLGAAIGAVGGRAVAEGAKAGARGARLYGSRAHHHDHMVIGGAV